MWIGTATSQWRAVNTRLFNIPKGQFMRLRRNCTNLGDYTLQAQKIGHIFVDKGYKREHIDEKIMEVADMNRTKLISDKRSVEQRPDLVTIILDYNFKYRKIEKIVKETLAHTASR